MPEPTLHPELQALIDGAVDPQQPELHPELQALLDGSSPNLTQQSPKLNIVGGQDLPAPVEEQPYRKTAPMPILGGEELPPPEDYGYDPYKSMTAVGKARFQATKLAKAVGENVKALGTLSGVGRFAAALPSAQMRFGEQTILGAPMISAGYAAKAFQAANTAFMSAEEKKKYEAAMPKWLQDANASVNELATAAVDLGRSAMQGKREYGAWTPETVAEYQNILEAPGGQLGAWLSNTGQFFAEMGAAPIKEAAKKGLGILAKRTAMRLGTAAMIEAPKAYENYLNKAESYTQEMAQDPANQGKSQEQIEREASIKALKETAAEGGISTAALALISSNRIGKMSLLPSRLKTAVVPNLVLKGAAIGGLQTAAMNAASGRDLMEGIIPSMAEMAAFETAFHARSNFGRANRLRELGRAFDSKESALTKLSSDLNELNTEIQTKTGDPQFEKELPKLQEGVAALEDTIKFVNENSNKVKWNKNIAAFVPVTPEAAPAPEAMPEPQTTQPSAEAVPQAEPSLYREATPIEGAVSELRPWERRQLSPETLALLQEQAGAQTAPTATEQRNPLMEAITRAQLELDLLRNEKPDGKKGANMSAWQREVALAERKLNDLQSVAEAQRQTTEVANAPEVRQVEQGSIGERLQADAGRLSAEAGGGNLPVQGGEVQAPVQQTQEVISGIMNQTAGDMSVVLDKYNATRKELESVINKGAAKNATRQEVYAAREAKIRLKEAAAQRDASLARLRGRAAQASPEQADRLFAKTREAIRRNASGLQANVNGYLDIAVALIQDLAAMGVREAKAFVERASEFLDRRQLAYIEQKFGGLEGLHAAAERHIAENKIELPRYNEPAPISQTKGDVFGQRFEFVDTKSPEFWQSYNQAKREIASGKTPYANPHMALLYAIGEDLGRAGLKGASQFVERAKDTLTDAEILDLAKRYLKGKRPVEDVLAEARRDPVKHNAVLNDILGKAYEDLQTVAAPNVMREHDKKVLGGELSKALGLHAETSTNADYYQAITNKIGGIGNTLIDTEQRLSQFMPRDKAEGVANRLRQVHSTTDLPYDAKRDVVRQMFPGEENKSVRNDIYKKPEFQMASTAQDVTNVIAPPTEGAVRRVLGETLGEKVLDVPVSTAQGVAQAYDPTALGGPAAKRFAADKAKAEAEAHAILAKHIRDLTPGAAIIERMPQADSVKVFDAIENPGSFEIKDRALRQFVESVKEFYADDFKWQQDAGVAEGYIDNYMRHSFKAPKGVDVAATLKRISLEGNLGYLKERTGPATIKEALAAGLELAEKNPTRYILQDMANRMKFRIIKSMSDMMQESGTLLRGPADAKIPTGYEALPFDFVKSFNLVNESELGRSKVIVPKEIAKILKNYASEGFERGSFPKAYKSMRAINNALNAIQLGISGYHFGFVSLDAANSLYASALQDIARGGVKEALTLDPRFRQNVADLIYGTMRVIAPQVRLGRSAGVAKELLTNTDTFFDDPKTQYEKEQARLGDLAKIGDADAISKLNELKTKADIYAREEARLRPIIERGMGPNVTKERRVAAEAAQRKLDSLTDWHGKLKRIFGYEVPKSMGESLRDLMVQGGVTVTPNTYDISTSWNRMFGEWKDAFDPRLAPGERAVSGTKALVDTVSSPTNWLTHQLMEKYVPLMKLGAFSIRMAKSLQHMPADATPHEKALMARKAWDSVENRMGQLNYNNLNWSKKFKQSLMLATRSVGWNLGSMRELLGAVADTVGNVSDVTRSTMAKTPADLADIRQNRAERGLLTGDVITDRQSFVLSTVFNEMLWNGVLTYLLTPTMPKGLDFFYARTGGTDDDGQPSRIALPSYMKEALELGGIGKQVAKGEFREATSHTLNYIKSKASPLISLTSEIATGTDWRGMPSSPVEALGKAAMPFSVRQAMDAYQTGETARSAATMGVGLTRPKRSLVYSDATKEALKALQDASPRVLVKNEVEHREMVNKLRKAYINKKFDDIDAAIEKGELSGQDLSKIYGTAPDQFEYLSRLASARSLNFERVKPIWEHATPEERMALWAPIVQQFKRSMGSASPAMQDKMREEFYKMSEEYTAAARQVGAQ